VKHKRQNPSVVTDRRSLDAWAQNLIARCLRERSGAREMVLCVYCLCFVESEYILIVYKLCLSSIGFVLFCPLLSSLILFPWWPQPV
jgi:hypothetical protein